MHKNRLIDCFIIALQQGFSKIVTKQRPEIQLVVGLVIGEMLLIGEW
jgi:hypothetical protein